MKQISANSITKVKFKLKTNTQTIKIKQKKPIQTQNLGNEVSECIFIIPGNIMKRKTYCLTFQLFLLLTLSSSSLIQPLKAPLLLDLASEEIPSFLTFHEQKTEWANEWMYKYVPEETCGLENINPEVISMKVCKVTQETTASAQGRGLGGGALVLGTEARCQDRAGGPLR